MSSLCSLIIKGQHMIFDLRRLKFSVFLSIAWSRNKSALRQYRQSLASLFSDPISTRARRHEDVPSRSQGIITWARDLSEDGVWSESDFCGCSVVQSEPVASGRRQRPKTFKIRLLSCATQRPHQIAQEIGGLSETYHSMDRVWRFREGRNNKSQHLLLWH